MRLKANVACSVHWLEEQLDTLVVNTLVLDMDSSVRLLVHLLEVNWKTATKIIISMAIIIIRVVMDDGSRSVTLQPESVSDFIVLLWIK